MKAGVVVRPGTGAYARPGKDQIGPFTEFLAANQNDLALNPANLPMTKAATPPLVTLTARQALVERTNLRPRPVPAG